MAINQAIYNVLIDSGMEYTIAAILSDPTNPSNPLAGAVQAKLPYVAALSGVAPASTLTNTSGVRAFVVGYVTYSQTVAANPASVAYTTTVGGLALANQVIASVGTSTASQSGSVGITVPVDPGATFTLVLTNASATAGALNLVTL